MGYLLLQHLPAQYVHDLKAYNFESMFLRAVHVIIISKLPIY